MLDPSTYLGICLDCARRPEHITKQSAGFGAGAETKRVLSLDIFGIHQKTVCFRDLTLADFNIYRALTQRSLARGNRYSLFAPPLGGLWVVVINDQCGTDGVETKICCLFQLNQFSAIIQPSRIPESLQCTRCTCQYKVWGDIGSIT